MPRTSGVADKHHAVVDDVLLHDLPAFGYQVAAVLEELAVLEEGREVRVGDEVVVDVRRREPRFRQLFKHENDADRDRILVRVQESAARHAHRGIAHDRVCGALITCEVEALLDRLFPNPDHRLHAQAQVLRFKLAADPGFLGKEGVNAFGHDRHLCAHLLPASFDAGEVGALAQEAIDLDAGND